MRHTRRFVLAAVLVGMLTAPSAATSAQPALSGTWQVFVQSPPLQPGQMMGPLGVGLDRTGNVYVADEDGRLHKLAPDGQPLGAWPIAPLGILHSGIRGVAIDDTGAVYVTDGREGQSRVRKVSSDGHLVAEWGTDGSAPGQLRGAAALALDAAGNVYVADMNNQRIQKLSPNGEPLGQWGHQGRGLGEFETPTGIALASDGSIWVADPGTGSRPGSLQHLAGDGRPLERLALPDDARRIKPGDPTPRRLPRRPTSVALDTSGNIFVGDFDDAVVVKLAPNGDVLASYPGVGEAGHTIPYPAALAVDGQGNVYIAQNRANRVQKLNGSLEPVGQMGLPIPLPGQFGWPRHVAVDSRGVVYVIGQYARIQRFLPDGTVLPPFAENPYAPVWRSDTSGRLAVGPDDTLYFGNVPAQRVDVMTVDGALITSLGNPEGKPSGAPGEFAAPQAVAIDAAANIYVAGQDSRLQKLDPGGNPLATWGGRGNGLGQFDFPTGLAVDRAANLLYVADSHNHRIVQLTTDGEVRAIWGKTPDENGYGAGDGPGEFFFPNDVAVDASGNVWIVDAGHSRIQVLSRSGEPLASWGSEGDQPGQFHGPDGIAAASDGSIYVADTANMRIQRFVPDGVTP